jgi:hypothetical protein
VKEGSSSFLKKRTKKLLSVSVGVGVTKSNLLPRPRRHREPPVGV